MAGFLFTLYLRDYFLSGTNYNYFTGRALDNQVFVFAISPARGEKGYIAWGHSQVTSPWGKVLAQAGHEEEIIFCDLDFAECDAVRQQIPIFKQRRTDIYDTVSTKT